MGSPAVSWIGVWGVAEHSSQGDGAKLSFDQRIRLLNAQAPLKRAEADRALGDARKSEAETAAHLADVGERSQIREQARADQFISDLREGARKREDSIADLVSLLSRRPKPLPNKEEIHDERP